ncbi:MAG: hypothetical protein BLITH_1513 [Brockia lithotrophica]|uniref:GH43/DUF377 family glycosyl hydrolase n=1 Tax=Brockia lithotrophica TaxID=933949 RepID=A0A2T5G5H9_9BACL|nr:MAG: hypothetical protein BLITH_1513 [Brockia lithotrophica]
MGARPLLKLERLSDRPILEPRPHIPWERAAVFNAAAVLRGGYVHLLYRASDRPFSLESPEPDPARKFTSVIAYAVGDGLRFERFDKPVLLPRGEDEAWGVEDPRVTEIEGAYAMVYTAFGGKSWFDYRPKIAFSRDLRTWEGRRVLLDEVNKDVALFPERIRGRYALLHRRLPHIWIAFSADLVCWEDHRILLPTVPGTWEGKKVGIGGPPHKTREGWVLFYHAVDEANVYRLGVALLDREDPTKVLARYPYPILEPELPWEREGLVPNVVFSSGSVEKDGIYYVYYGAADTVLGVAAQARDRIVDQLARFA